MSRTEYTIYDPATGEITKSGTTSDKPETKISPGECLIVGQELDGTKWQIVNGTLSPKPEDLADVVEEATGRIDVIAESLRGQYITQGTGQAMIYLTKEQESDRFLALTPADQLAADPAAFPLMSADATASQMALIDIANEIYRKKEQWKVVASIIEKFRIKAKKDVREATDVNFVRSAPELFSAQTSAALIANST